ncbi:FtsH protease activity modulator HflK [Zavarzinia compransoris]|uniref:Protein HflK n=1 Tax=Zavarzinia compransoris TaxID=1264899 RepID=A0A317E5L2_9PROT|nr:FtsH protease activity modulator HflK [Zavarzinia compransoris]PWR22357.1 FtsH protease activity modulator HflK [Zavarzinia compransoris]TDP46875.1 protease FtsH subunit HflK [Zavarzinia compransoris]
MPWQNNGGPWGGGGNNGGGGNRGPWGQGPRGPGGGGQPPNLEDLLRRGQDRFKDIMPGGGWGKRGILLGGLVLAFVWGITGFYRVEPDELGMVTRFGKWVETTPPGLHYHLPAPIESVATLSVTTQRRVDVGLTTNDGVRGLRRENPDESLILTGDENIADVAFSVFWVIDDASRYLFNVQDPDTTVRAVAISAMREVIGRSRLQEAQTEGREKIAREARDLIQSVLTAYGAGVQVTQLQLHRVDPPGAVIEAYRDVQAARANQEQYRNEAEAYYNDKVPQARGLAEKILQEAEGYRQQVVADAQGQAARFLSVLTAYNASKDVTMQRIYIETMEGILRNMNKILIDGGSGTQGVLPYLPLPELGRAPGTGGQ